MFCSKLLLCCSAGTSGRQGPTAGRPSTGGSGSDAGRGSRPQRQQQQQSRGAPLAYSSSSSAGWRYHSREASPAPIRRAPMPGGSVCGWWLWGQASLRSNACLQKAARCAVAPSMRPPPPPWPPSPRRLQAHHRCGPAPPTPHAPPPCPPHAPPPRAMSSTPPNTCARGESGSARRLDAPTRHAGHRARSSRRPRPHARSRGRHHVSMAPNRQPPTSPPGDSCLTTIGALVSRLLQGIPRRSAAG